MHEKVEAVNTRPSLPLPSTPDLKSNLGAPIGRRGRLALSAWSLLLLGVFGAALSVQPDPRGFGTHEAFGLPPCTFRVVFGIPCPSCGLTTSFAHLVRGEIRSAMRAHPLGPLLGALLAAQIPWCWISIWKGRLWRIAHPQTFLLGLLSAVTLAMLGVWLLRLALG